MSILAINRIRLRSEAVDKVDAIRQAGELLVTTGCITPEYVEGMLAREQNMSTYLGNGVAIPHGEYDNRQHILKTGISVVQIPAGVEWEMGEMVHLVIGIAASSDEHVGVLTRLANVVEDDVALQILNQTHDPQIVFETLSA
ncbi:MAG: PTS sugar transporter subunit IIA [Chloroflexota bacterium]|jgi:phosphocarrier protein FPr|nr:PTS sugar transporter subunit IIA [Chloroflexota bacterium]